MVFYWWYLDLFVRNEYTAKPGQRVTPHKAGPCAERSSPSEKVLVVDFTGRSLVMISWTLVDRHAGRSHMY